MNEYEELINLLEELGADGLKFFDDEDILEVVFGEVFFQIYFTEGSQEVTVKLYLATYTMGDIRPLVRSCNVCPYRIVQTMKEMAKQEMGTLVKPWYNSLKRVYSK